MFMLVDEINPWTMSPTCRDRRPGYAAVLYVHLKRCLHTTDISTPHS